MYGFGEDEDKLGEIVILDLVNSVFYFFFILLFVFEVVRLLFNIVVGVLCFEDICY